MARFFFALKFAVPVTAKVTSSDGTQGQGQVGGQGQGPSKTQLSSSQEDMLEELTWIQKKKRAIEKANRRTRRACRKVKKTFFYNYREFFCNAHISIGCEESTDVLGNHRVGVFKHLRVGHRTLPTTRLAR